MIKFNFKIEFESVEYPEPKWVAYSGVGAEAELTALLSEQMAREIDRDILQTLREQVRFEAPTWEVNTANPYPTITQEEMVRKINEVSNMIAERQRQAPASWVVMGSKAVRRINDALDL